VFVIAAPDDAQVSAWLGDLPAPTLVVRHHTRTLDPGGTVAALLFGVLGHPLGLPEHYRMAGVRCSAAACPTERTVAGGERRGRQRELV
jgi:hypothetical protein